MSENNNATQPAFPTIKQSSTPEYWSTVAGLTKREYFAAMAMQGLLASADVDAFGDMKSVAEQSIVAADAVLNQLKN